MYTFADAVRHTRDWWGSDGVAQRDLRDALGVVQAALREITQAHTWRLYYATTRINLHAPVSAGTIRYQAVSGSSPRLVTLTGSTWPAWASEGHLRIGAVLYTVDERKSDTLLTLSALDPPVGDLVSGTAYQLVQDSYRLPSDWRAGADAYHEQTYPQGIQYVHPTFWLESVRAWEATGTPQFYTVLADRRFPGTLVMRVWPPSEEERTLDFFYRRGPRPLKTYSTIAGTVTVTAGEPEVVGLGTSFQASDVGSVLRIGSSRIVPTSLDDLTPYIDEAIVLSVEDATHLTLAVPSSQTGAGRGYEISDPIDIEESVMLTAFQRCLEWQASLKRSTTDKPNPFAAWNRALVDAKAANGPSFGGRVAGASLIPLRPLFQGGTLLGGARVGP